MALLRGCFIGITSPGRRLTRRKDYMNLDLQAQKVKVNLWFLKLARNLLVACQSNQNRKGGQTGDLLL